MRRILNQAFCLATIVATLMACSSQAEVPATTAASQSQESPITSPMPATTAAPAFRKIASVVSDPRQAKTIDGGRVLQFYLSVLSSQKQIDDLKNQDLTQRIQVDLEHELLVMVEWGVYPSSGIQVTVSAVQISPSIVDVTVEAGKTDPSLESFT